MEKITFYYSKALNFVKNEEVNALQDRVSRCHKMLHHGTGLGSDYLEAFMMWALSILELKIIL